MSNKCPNCGKPVPTSALQGLCPECMLQLGAASQTDTGGEPGPHGTKVLKPPPTLDEIARHFPQFEILECLGRGGMGVVYKARQPKLNRVVALKILAPEKVAETRFAERFEREAQALARLNHPNIVTVHDFGETDGLYYLLMEFVDGASLRQLIRTRKLAPPEALAIVPKICEALQFAHDKGVVHRDIKPENVLVDTSGQVKIADFGIAKIVTGTEQSLTRPSDTLSPSDGERAGVRGAGSLTQDQIVGTPNYMAPEQVEKPQLVDHRADIFSLGVVFYEMLTGELPLGKFQPPSKKVQVDVRLDEVVLHALEKEPERRYQHVSEVKSAVETIATTRPTHAVVPPQRTKINWIPALVFYVLTTVVEVMILEADLKYPGLSDAFLPIILMVAVFVTATVLWALLHYRCWKALPERFRATTPGRAVGRLFIPLYNFYWGFISFPKLADGFNAIRAEHPHLPLVNMRRLGLALAVLLMCNWTLFWVPFLGSCVSLADLIVFIFFYRGIVHNANLVIDAGPSLSGDDVGLLK